MDRNEILNMEAGRELDELIALEIFKAKKSEYKGPIKIYETDEYRWRDWELPEWSNDIEMAWWLVEKLTNLELGDKMRTFKIVRATKYIEPKGEYNPWGYDAYFGPRYDPSHHSDLVAWGDTAPEAICKAALLSKFVAIVEGAA